jgi:hypothetical protein
MAKNDYLVLKGIDYPPNKRAEAGEVVSDLPKDSIPWLLESGIIERTGATKAEVETKPAIKAEDVDTQPIRIVSEDALAKFGDKE